MAKLSIPITKAKETIEIDTDTISEEMFREALYQGLKQMANRNSSKITKANAKDEEEFKRLAKDQGEKNVKAIVEGDTKVIKLTGAPKAKKASGAVMTEARRLAKNLVKDELKKAGYKISHIAASEITRLANLLLEQDKALIEKAEANIKAREEEKVPESIVLKDIVKVDPELVKKAEAKKKPKDQLSAKQAGLTAKAKPKGQGEARPN